jgi:hypothetical protein
MGQKAKGQIKYKNTGEFDLPEIRILPEWPEDFSLLSSTPTLTNDQFVLRSLVQGEEGIIEFEGSLYYLRLMRPNNPVLSSDLHCSGQTPIPAERPFQLEAGIKVSQRTKLFIEALKVSCTGKPSPEIRIGFTIPDSFLPKLKNKKLFFNPFGGLQFYGEF